MEFHEVASIFPMMPDDELALLAEDIKANGLREPIWLHPTEGSIIDGRNRYRACGLADVEPRYRLWNGRGSLVSFVVSLNLHRRHLNESQRGMVAARVANMGRGNPSGNNQYGDGNAPIGAFPSQGEAAELLNVGRRTLQRAKAVQDKGVPELRDAVMSGGVSVSAASQVATLPPLEQIGIVAQGEKEILAAAKVIRERQRTERKAERVERIQGISEGNAELDTDVTYPVIYADPPWRYEHSSTDSRQIENHYPTMDLADICALPVSDLATPDAVLFLWATSPKLAESMQVLEAWGFVYRTCIVWDKEIIGMGYYARQQHELLLIAARGSLPVPDASNRPASVVRLRRENRHSRKPDEFYDIIESMYPEYKKIELFARGERTGWGAWGNEAT